MMRLLYFNGNGDFSLAEFSKSTIPEYAILSHTWEEEEVTFEDLQNGTGTKKDGYKKIRFCAEQAKRDGLQYFWVDTCCIDKSNATELAEAINSMFRWYRMSTKCYVYLPDVSRTAVNTDGQAWESAFRKSRWFTRGWTLQELIAPRSVEFFCRESKRIGSKSSLEQQIHEITGIPKPALQGAYLSQFNDKERFSWIQPRQTKVEEDKAYALLGIFDVQMPLRYGEGMANAFKRLEEEIDKFNKCLQDLRLSDPRDDKTRIEDTKGGLLEGSYHWVLETSDFQRWRDDQQSRLLWIKGDPGKGKTMLLCGIINELEKSMSKTDTLSYFFCQATDSRINHATAVLRGLLYLLVNQQPSLISHIQKKHDHAGKSLFEDVNAWIAMSEIFTSILQDPSLRSTFLIIDALDECVVARSKLLDFIVQKSSVSPCVKWVISSRNWPDIEERLERAGHKIRLCLELNPKSVSAAVRTYVKYKTRQLADEKDYDDRTREAVLQHLVSNADNTFLWVALVYENLKDVPRWKAIAKLKEFPPGLDLLYQRMLNQICESDDADLCKQILAIVSTVYRPITLIETTSFIETLVDIANDHRSLAAIIGLCGSFLSLREDTISFVHQSAKDFLIKKAYEEILPLGIDDIHYTIFSRSVLAMSNTLRRDIYELRAPGISIDQVKPPFPDPLAAIQYSCLYWVDHLLECQTRKDIIKDLKDSGLVYSFLHQYFLYWLEALSLLKSVSEGVVMIRKLENLQFDRSPDLRVFIKDGSRFAVSNRSIIEQAPLQAYCSALVFAPEKSIIRETFEGCIPSWILRKPRVETHWNAMLQVLEGHTHQVTSVAFSPDGKQIVSGSGDRTVRRWDAATGQQLLPALEGHTDSVTSVAFSPDGKQIVSGSGDRTVRRWDAATGQQLLPALEGNSIVTSVAFSPDGKQIVSGSWDRTVWRWDAATGQQLLPALEGHTDSVTSVAFSPDGKQIVSGSGDRTVRRWDAATGQQLLPALEGNSIVTSVAFSPDGKQIVSGSGDRTVWRWDAATGQQLLPALEGHTDSVTSVAFSPDGKQIVSRSEDQTFQRYTRPVTSVAFSPDGKQIPTLYISENWLAEGTTNLLWLPSSYRPTCEATCGGIIALGHSSGGLSVLQLQEGPKLIT